MTRKTLACFAVIFLASFAFGQNSQSFAVVDNTPNCSGSTGAFLCWTTLQLLLDANGNPKIVNASVGPADGSVFAATSNYYPYILTPQTSGAPIWVRKGAYGVRQLAVQDANDVYVITNITTGCGSGDHQMGINNSDFTAWTYWGGCAAVMSVSADATVGIVQTGGRAKFKRAGDQSWTTILPDDGQWMDITVQSSTLAYGRKGSTIYKINLSNNTVSTVSGVTDSITYMAAGSLSVDAGNILWVMGPLVTDNGFHTDVYRQDMTALSGWKQIHGWFSFVFVGGGNAVSLSNGTAYATTLTAPQLTTTTTFTGNLGSSKMVATVANARVKAGGLHGDAAVSSVSALGNVANTANATETAVLCDLSFGDVGSDSCTFASESEFFTSDDTSDGPLCTDPPGPFLSKLDVASRSTFT